MENPDFFTNLVTRDPAEYAAYLSRMLVSLSEEERQGILAVLIAAFQDMYQRTKELEDQMSIEHRLPLDEERLT